MATQTNLITFGPLSNCWRGHLGRKNRSKRWRSLASLTILTVAATFPAINKAAIAGTNWDNWQNRTTAGHHYDQSLKNQPSNPKQAQESQTLLTNIKLTQQLSAKHTYGVSGKMAGEVFRSLQTSSRIGIWIDRRIDISKEITLPQNPRSYYQTIREIAAQADGDVSVLPTMVVITPKKHTGQFLLMLEAAKQQVTKLPVKARTKLLQKTDASWPRLSRPAELLKRFLDQVPEIDLIDSKIDSTPLPHDLWDKAQFPKTDRLSLITLIAFGFEKSVHFSSKQNSVTVTIQPISETPKLTILIKSSHFKKKLRKDLRGIRAKHPNLKIYTRMGTFQISGASANIGTLLTELNAWQPKLKNKKGKSAYSLTFKGPSTVGLLQSIAKNEDLTLQIPPDIKKNLTTNALDIKLKNVTVNELLSKALEGTPFKATIKNGALIIHR